MLCLTLSPVSLLDTVGRLVENIVIGILSEVETVGHCMTGS
jgi:hypothetical protein